MTPVAHTERCVDEGSDEIKDLLARRSEVIQGGSGSSVMFYKDGFSFTKDRNTKSVSTEIERMECKQLYY